VFLLGNVAASSAHWHFLQHAALPGLSLFSLAGDVHIAIMDRSGQLEVEVIEARGLTPKPGSKSLPGKAEQLEEGSGK
jgi:hypothetical protein